MRLEDMAHGLLGQVPSALGTPVLNMETDPNQEFTPSAYTQVERAFSIFLRQAQKEPDTTIRYPISDEMKALLATSGICETNRLKLGVFPNRVRLDAACAALFAVQYPNIPMIISCFSVEEAKFLHGSLPHRARWIAALPTVIYEEDIPAVEALLRYCHQHKVPVEVNSWDTWDLACRLTELSMEAGPGLAVLNAVAARELSLRGCASAMISSEADAKQIADLCAAAETPLSLTVFERPPLFISRVPLPECAQNEILSDSRGCRIKGRTEGRLSVYRPLSPYNWCDIRNDSIRVQHLVADLCASPDPVREYGALQKGIKDQTRFNFDRTLR